MEVLLAKTAGFCYGVKRAVDKVYETVETQGYLWYRIGEGQWIAGKEGWVEVK